MSRCLCVSHPSPCSYLTVPIPTLEASARASLCPHLTACLSLVGSFYHTSFYHTSLHLMPQEERSRKLALLNSEAPTEAPNQKVLAKLKKAEERLRKVLSSATLYRRVVLQLKNSICD